jgi:hypothetical protein
VTKKKPSAEERARVAWTPDSTKPEGVASCRRHRARIVLYTDPSPKQEKARDDFFVEHGRCEVTIVKTEIRPNKEGD